MERRRVSATYKLSDLIRQEYMVIAMAVLLAVAFSILLPSFATLGNFLTLVRTVSILGILGLGMTIVVIGRGLDLTIVAVMVATSATVMTVLNEGYSLPLAFAAGLAVALGIGFVNGFIIAFIEVPALFVTLATTFVVFGVARFTFATLVVYPPQSATDLLFFGQGRLLGVPMPIVIFVTMMVLVHLYLSRTTSGRLTYTRGDNPDAARLTGVNVRPDIVLSYMLSAAIGFVAGVVSGATTANTNLQTINSTLIFDVILVIVLGGVSLVGGRGGVLSLLAGAALIGVLLNGLTILNINSQVQDIIRGLVLLIAILLDNRLHPKDEETARQGD